MNTEKIEEILKEFDEKVGTYTNEYGYVHNIPNYEKIKGLIRQELTTSYTEGFTAGVEKARGVLNELNKGKYGHMTREIRDTDQFYTDAWHMLDAREAAALTQLTSTNEVK